MVIVTYFFQSNLLLPYRLLFLISSKGSCICAFPQTEQPLMDQLWTKLQMHLLCRIDQVIQTFTDVCSTISGNPNLYRCMLYHLIYVLLPQITIIIIKKIYIYIDTMFCSILFHQVLFQQRFITDEYDWENPARPYIYIYIYISIFTMT